MTCPWLPGNTDVLLSPLHTEVTPGCYLPFQTVAVVADNAAAMRYNARAYGYTGLLDCT